MIKRGIGIICLFLIFSKTWAQVNYVLNPSFENYSQCPTGYDQINLAVFWNGIDTSYTYSNPPPTDGLGEYLNICADSNLQYTVTVPWNDNFYHFPRTGFAMVGVKMLDTNGFYERDYLQGHLKSNLVFGKSYCVTYFVSQTLASYWSIKNIGAFLDDGTIDTAVYTSGLPQTQYTPQIIYTNYITIADSLSWVKVEGSFTANGTERFITIGDFNSNSATPKINYNLNSTVGPLTYYLIDDVSVIESNTKAFAWNSDTLHKGYLDSILIGRDEIIPGIKWYRDGVLIDTLHAGIWIKDDTLGSYHTYILSQTLCGLTTNDTVVVSVELVSSGIKNIKANESILLYPNPIENELTIANSPPATNIRVYDVVGRLVYSSVLQSKQESINTSDWKRGTYFVELILPDGFREVRKVVK